MIYHRIRGQILYNRTCRHSIARSATQAGLGKKVHCASQRGGFVLMRSRISNEPEKATAMWDGFVPVQPFVLPFGKATVCPLGGQNKHCAEHECGDNCRMCFGWGVNYVSGVFDACVITLLLNIDNQNSRTAESGLLVLV